MLSVKHIYGDVIRCGPYQAAGFFVGSAFFLKAVNAGHIVYGVKMFVYYGFSVQERYRGAWVI